MSNFNSNSLDSFVIAPIQSQGHNDRQQSTVESDQENALGSSSDKTGD